MYGNAMVATKTSTLVLIVEDDADSFDWMRRRLNRYGYEVEWARSLVDGFNKLDARPCCLILDLSLPDGNGAAILREIRDRSLPIKVAVVSGVKDHAVLNEAANLNPDAFFLKPVDAIELMGWLNSACA